MTGGADKIPLLAAFQMRDHVPTGWVGVAIDDQFHDALVFVEAVRMVPATSRHRVAEIERRLRS